MKKLSMLILAIGMTLAVCAQQKAIPVTLSMKNASLTAIIQRVQEMTDTRVVYDDATRTVLDSIHMDVNEKDIPLNILLQNICLPNSLLSEISGNTITIKKVNFLQNGEKKTRVLRGVVKDDSGELMTGATVTLKGTRIATITNFDGEFKLDIPEMENPTLSVSFMGMEPKTIKVGQRNDIVVVLSPDSHTMSDVVVTGYQRIRKGEMVGSNSVIKGKDLTIVGTNTLEQMLQGKLAGVVVTNSSGVVGQRQRTRVRGTSTLLGSQEPVWVVDGVIQTDPLPFKQQELNSLGDISQDNMDMIRNFVGSAISWLDPNDIETITVLKDASATVLYGVKAANGVIVITTKRGQKGRMSVGYHGGVSVGERVNYDRLNLMNSRQRNDVSREIYERRLVSSRDLEPIGYEGLLRQYLAEEMSYEEFDRAAKKLDTNNTDWFDLLYRNPFSHNHSVSLSGGGDQASYRGSIFANSNNGTQRGNSSMQYGGSLHLDASLGKKVQVSMNLAGSYGKTNSYSSYVNPYSYASTTSRVIPAFNEDGSYFYYPYHTYGYLYNVLNEQQQSGNSNDTRSMNLSARLQWDVVKGLRFESTLGFQTSNTSGANYATERTYSITQLRGYEYGTYTPADEEYLRSRLPHGGQLSSVDNRSLSYTWTNQLGYNTVIGKDHRFNAMLGQEVRSEKYDGHNSMRYGYLPERGKTFILPPLTYISSNQTFENGLYKQMTDQIVDRTSNFIGLFASASYSFKERYTTTASIRTDASNRFGQDTRNRFLPVWSLGTRWNMINEPWMQQQNWMSDMALRMSYGWQGNAVENYGPQLVARIPSNPIDNRTGEYILNIRSLAYPDLRWERTNTWNIGLDLGFWHNRIQATLEYYHKLTTDMLVEKQVPAEFGVQSTPVNGGQMSNSGVELSISTTLLQTKKMNWTLSLNTAKNFNRIESTINENKNWRSATAGAINKEGFPVRSVWAFQFAGINQENGDPTFLIPSASENPDGVNDATAYMVHMGSLDPDFTGGLSTSFRYGNVSLSAGFNLNLGGVRFLAPMFSDDIVEDVPSAYNNLPRDFVNHWCKPGDETDVPGIPSRSLLNRRVQLPNEMTESSYRMYNYSDLRIVSGSFFRCTNLGVNYFLPRTLVSHWGLNNLSLSFNVSNPFLIKASGYKGLDPEVATGGQPITRNFSFNINISL